MELAVSLPADLAVLADPTARGAAPSLRPPDAAGASPLPGTPFELCLALLTAEPPDGEVWPVTGKELPLLPLDAAADADLRSDLDAAALAAFAPASMAELAVQACLGAGDEAAPLPSAGNPLPPPLAQAPPALALPPAGEPVPADSSLLQGEAAPDPLGVLAPAHDEAALADDSSAPPSAPLTAAGKSPAPSWLEALAAERRSQRPPAASGTEARVPPAAEPEQLAAMQPSSATAAAVEATSPQPIVRRVEAAKTLASAVAATANASPTTDWLPAAASHSAAPAGAAAAPAAAAPQAPVDLRSPGWQEAFASRVQVLVDTKVGEARIKLNPPELGAVDVEISLVDDKTFVHLTTATAAARDELAQSLPRLRELFTVSGLELGGASVHNGHDRQQGENRHGAAPAARHSAAFASLGAEGNDDGPAPAPRRALGRIDVFA